MWQWLMAHWYRSRLKRAEYASLFDTPPPNEWVAVDCETTGLDRQRDEIISIGAVLIRGNQIMTSQRLELFIRPTVHVAAESIRIHRLRSMDVANGLEPQVAIQQFLDFVGNRPLVGYYLEFDVAMLNRLVRPFLGIPLPQRQIEVSGMYYDYKYAQQVGSNVDLHFHTMMKHLNLPEREEHDAFNDALMAAMMFIKLRHLKQ
jgi:DNA polymerase III subunit epsilon